MTQCLQVSDAFKAIQSRLDDPSLPPTVRENVEQHFESLISLAHNLKALGVEQAEIDHHVGEIYQKYEAALDMNISRIREIEDSIVISDNEVEL